MENKQVAFRRIKGRIVPIRISKDKQFKTGLVDIAKGVAATAAAGVVASEAVIQSAAMRIRSKDLFRIAGSDLPSVTSKAIQLRTKAAQLRKFRLPVLAIGGIIGTAYIAGGVNDVLKSKFGKELSDKNRAKITGVAALGPTLAGAFYYKRLGVPLNAAWEYAKVVAKGGKKTWPLIPIKTKYGPLKF
jgi:hypothetical protein